MVVAAAASGDVDVVREYLTKHSSAVSQGFVIIRLSSLLF